jgi:hypothetical protein
MDFFIWLMVVKKLRSSVSECKDVYSKLSNDEQDKLQDEYVTGGYDD